jgi:hypothetical protein
MLHIPLLYVLANNISKYSVKHNYLFMRENVVNTYQ